MASDPEQGALSGIRAFTVQGIGDFRSLRAPHGSPAITVPALRFNYFEKERSKGRTLLK